jgi:hypothetical protein
MEKTRSHAIEGIGNGMTAARLYEKSIALLQKYASKYSCLRRRRYTTNAVSKKENGGPEPAVCPSLGRTPLR